MTNTQLGKVVKNITMPADQFTCNSCWAIATCQVMSDHLRLKGTIPLSDELNYYAFHDYLAARYPKQATCYTGALLDSGMKESVSVGAPLMSESQDREFDDRYLPSDIGNKLYRAKGWKNLSGSVNSIISALESSGPVIAVINLYGSFMNFVGSSPYRPKPNESTDSMVHMLSIVGYNLPEQCWIMRNSYGTRFGIGGFCKIKWSDPYLNPEQYVYSPIL